MLLYSTQHEDAPWTYIVSTWLLDSYDGCSFQSCPTLYLLWHRTWRTDPRTI